MKLYLKGMILVLVACAAAACSPTWHQTPFESSGPESASLVSSRIMKDLQPMVCNDSEDMQISAPPCPSSGKADVKEPQQILDHALELCRASQRFWAQGDFENAVSSLDKAYSLILRAHTNENSKLMQQKEDIRFMICKRMLEIYASQHTVVNGNHNAIPMVMNRHVQEQIDRFKDPEKQFFLNSFKRSGKYRPEIVKSLEAAGLPEELSWLPLIESGFIVKALSRARALGLWQFIPSTGYKFGLNRDQWIDERMDMLKSTQAAIAYLQELHKIFGDWCTVLAAYNCGEARVLRVIRNQNVNYLDNFWDLYKKLPQETACYVPRFLAALHIINNPERFGFDLKDLDSPLTYDLVTVSRQMQLNDIAKVLDVSGKSLEILNPELRYNVTPPVRYGLKVPKGQGSILIARLNEIPVYIPPKTSYASHVVRPGQTLSQLASSHRTSVSALMKANNLQRQDHIVAGQKLKIPMKARRPVDIRASKAAGYKLIQHRVTRGDSLWLLASRHNTNIREIMHLNNLKGTRLYIGQKLVIPAKTLDQEPGAGTKSYKVKPGDTPYQIAMKYQMELKRFLCLNDLTPRSKIFPGQVFWVDAK